jgi:carbamoyl-phosphate synthase large subunit
LDQAVEVDVDVLCDGTDVVVGGIMEHIEMAGVHSGDSACSLPPWSLDRVICDEIRRQARVMALEIGVRGLMNVQFAVAEGTVYVLEVNPRASRTVPFVSKAVGVPLAKIAARVMAGESLASLGFTKEVVPSFTSVKESVFPFIKFPGVDTLLGPEMKSTGEVMGIDPTFGLAFAKAEIAAGNKLPDSGTAFVSVREEDRGALERVARKLVAAGIRLVATEGTAEFLRARGLECERVNKVREGSPHAEDLIRSGGVSAVINTVGTPQSIEESFSLRRAALETGVPYFTTAAAAIAAAEGIALLDGSEPSVNALQDLHSTTWG